MLECQYAAVAGSLDDDFLYKHLFIDALRVVVLAQACSKLLNLCDSLGALRRPGTSSPFLSRFHLINCTATRLGNC